MYVLAQHAEARAKSDNTILAVQSRLKIGKRTDFTSTVHGISLILDLRTNFL